MLELKTIILLSTPRVNSKHKLDPYKFVLGSQTMRLQQVQGNWHWISNKEKILCEILQYVERLMAVNGVPSIFVTKMISLYPHFLIIFCLL